MQATGCLWEIYLRAKYDGKEINIQADDVAIMMALLKIARLAVTPEHRDSAVDGAAYLAIAHECATNG